MENGLFVYEISYPGEDFVQKENFFYSFGDILRGVTVTNQIEMAYQ